MGFGDFGSNGSVHWQINYEKAPNSPADHLDYDDTKKHPGKPGADPREPIGQGKAGSGFLRVTIRCNNYGQARKMLNDAVANLAPNATNVVLDLPIRPYRATPPDPTARDEWEVGVDW